MPRPNVVFILPDEWRADAFGYRGNPDVRTPHLDKLAAQGLAFNNVIANTPVCCPARSVMLTGAYASRTGLVANDLRLRPDAGCVAHDFAAAGYETAFIGKWHLDGGPRLPGYVPPGPRRQGFQVWAANECNHMYFDNRYFRTDGELVVSHTYEPRMWTDEAVGYLERKHEKPFFLMLSIGAPHEPYVAPVEYMQRYDPAKLTMRPNWVEGTPKGGRKEIAGYYAAATAVDDQVGRLMATLELAGLAENTIVLFCSDHGNMLGSQGKVWKRKPYEESIGVPGIVRWPRAVKAGRRTDALLAHVDLAPTLLALCGLAVPARMQGTNLSATVLDKPGAKSPEAALLQIFGPSKLDDVQEGWRGLRTAGHTYARYRDAPWLLFDNRSDPYQQHNLVGTAPAATLQAQLDSQLTALMARMGDSWSLDWHDLIEDGGRLYDTETFTTVKDFESWEKTHPGMKYRGSSLRSE